jgi:hypothetical protein
MASLSTTIYNVMQQQAAAASSTPLGSGGVFNSGWQPTNGAGRICGYAGSNVAGTLNVFQSDAISGVGVGLGAAPGNYVTTTVTVGAGAQQSFSVEAVANYYYVRYTNGGTAQTTFYRSTNLRGI